MFDHRNFATQGLFPGIVTSRSVANLGHYEVQVIIQPVYGGGGGGPVSLSSAPTKYKIIIRVTRNGRTWEVEQIVSTAVARVTAKLLGKTLIEPSISIVNTSMVENVSPTIKVTVK